MGEHSDTKKTPLRGKSEFLRVLQWPADEDSQQPRALRGLARIVEQDLCHRCGTCVGICPTGVLDVDENMFPRVASLEACTDCDLCVKTCPGDEFDHRAFHQKIFDQDSDLRETHGHFEEALLACAESDGVRSAGTSGGLVTALLIALLKGGSIDGAVCIVADPKIPWHGKPIIARTQEQILEAAKSKYAITPTNFALQEILKLEGRYALVGLPCQIHGYRKAAELDPRIQNRVVLSIGLYCHAAVDLEGYRTVFEMTGRGTHNVQKFTSRIGKHPGTPYVEDFKGLSSPLYFPEKKGYRPSSMEILNLLYRLYSPPRCLTCYDAFSEFADIAVGDPWMPPPSEEIDFKQGWSSVLLRTERGIKAFRKAESGGAIRRYQLTREETLLCNDMMSTEKRWRAFRIIETNRRQGKPIPTYGKYPHALPQQKSIQFLKTEINMFTHLFCFLSFGRRFLVKLIFSDFGYAMLYLNNLRRELRRFIRERLFDWKQGLQNKTKKES